MKILIKNCNLISMDSKREKYEENMDILIENSIITKIDKNICISDPNIKYIDASNKIVMPGLINTHSHISMSIFRETVDGLKTQEWLTDKIWPMEDKLTTDDIYYSTLLSCLEMIKTGCTTINDMYFMTDSIIKAALESGIRLQTTRTLMGNITNDMYRLTELKNLIEKYKNEDLITFNVGIHGLYTSNEPYIKECIKLAQQESLPIHMHFCENQQERNDIIRDYNVKNPAEIIKRDFNNIHNILAHCVKLSDEDINILKSTNSYISHCPISNLKLGCGVANISKMLSEGICVSLGTDGQGSGCSLDMFETMKFTALLQKGLYEDPKLLQAYDVLKMATINGAKTLQLDSEIGSIEEFKKADLIIIDPNTIISQPQNDIFAELVYNINGSNVDTTIINGNILMENKEIKNTNLKNIITACNNIIDRIKKEI